ncbi:apolipoprotein C-II [Loxodonta africana]|uniref:Apolipoprotein C-II n=1 Tax=Loxodonta africana TaxID=9785 RepID=G3TW86_LOXAF|nr:apolipoprotein C-II [Loxodonta africana]XP_049757804.1 apolipoprotein C-II [Elephas maximus indicus]
MDTRYLLAVFFILLVLGLEVQGDLRPQAEEADGSTFLTWVQKSLRRYWDAAKTTAEGLYQKTALPTVNEKIGDMYTKCTSAATTYLGILTDQIVSIVKGEE